MRVLIVDDEPLARTGLRRELLRMPGYTCIGECASRDEAVGAIVAERPDVVLLDVQLGAGNGFEVIEEIGIDAMPLIIFVTAHDRHALRAFEVHAIDYVMKPVEPERLREALDRASEQLALSDPSARTARLSRLDALQAELAHGRPGRRPIDRVVVPDGNRLTFVNVAAIDWIEAAGNYVRIHAAGRVYVLRSTLTQMGQRICGTGALDPPFVRIRRSALVNAAAIATLEPYSKGMFTVRLRDGSEILSSRYHQQGLRQLMRRAE